MATRKKPAAKKAAAPRKKPATKPAAKKAAAPRRRSTKSAPAKPRKRAPTKAQKEAKERAEAAAAATEAAIEAELGTLAVGLEDFIADRIGLGQKIDPARLAALRMAAANLDTQHRRYTQGQSDRPVSASLLKEYGAILDGLGERGPDDDDPFRGLGGPPMGDTATT